MRRAVAVVIGAVLISAASGVLAASAASAPAPLYGVTIDGTGGISRLVRALTALPYRPMARVYFDVHESAGHYRSSVARIHAVAGVMGELLDSSDERDISAAALRARAMSYLATLSTAVDVWEIGNEVNGSWTGRYRNVEAKLAAAYGAVHAARRPAALTLYANNFGPDHCGDGARELTPLQFARRYMPASLRAGLSYVFLSYYPTQCGGIEPTADRVRSYLVRLHALFPAARLGFGELGLPHPTTRATLARAEQIMRWGYALDPRLRYYVGGYFWWYAVQDALRPSGPLAGELRRAFDREHAALRG